MMNRFIKIFFAVLTFTALSVSVFASGGGETLMAVKSFVLGKEKAEVRDANDDGIIDSIDISILKRDMIDASSILRTVRVSNSQELYDAIKNAEAGDEIIVSSGVYTWSSGGAQGSLYHGTADGTAKNPVTLRSEDPNNPAVLSGIDVSRNCVLYITGDYWIIKDISTTNSKKGIILDNSNYSKIIGCEVYNIGEEGIHLRDGSSYCTIYQCTVTDTGEHTPGYGEAIYVGSSVSTGGYAYNCDYNTISHCILGSGVTAELVDIKEYTTGTIVEYCEMYGGSISNEVSANSFLNSKGNDSIIRGNVCYDEGNTIIRNAFENHVIVEGWGYNNEFIDNTVSLINEQAYVLRVYSGTASESGSVRIPDGNIYR